MPYTPVRPLRTDAWSPSIGRHSFCYVGCAKVHRSQSEARWSLLVLLERALHEGNLKRHIGIGRQVSSQEAAVVPRMNRSRSVSIISIFEFSIWESQIRTNYLWIFVWQYVGFQCAKGWPKKKLWNFGNRPYQPRVNREFCFLSISTEICSFVLPKIHSRLWLWAVLNEARYVWAHDEEIAAGLVTGDLYRSPHS